MSNADDPRRKKLPEGEMAVEATSVGLYGRMREQGERFVLRNGRADFSFRWMKPVTGRAAEEVKDQERAKDQEPTAASTDEGVL